MGGVCIFPRGWASAFPPFGRLSIANAWRAAGSWPSSACVDPCGDLSLLLQRELPASQSVSAEGVTRRSAPGQVCGLALLTRLTCPHLDGRPPTAVGRVSSPRGVLQCLMPRNNIPHRIFYTYICHHPKPGYNVNVSCIATYTLSSIFFMYDNDGNTETDRTGAAQDYHLTICILILRNFRRPPPNPMMYMPARL